MPEQCPVCRARFRGARICSRCGADLSTLMWIAARARRLRLEAREALDAGDWGAAADFAARSCELRESPQGRTLLRIAEWMANAD